MEGTLEQQIQKMLKDTHKGLATKDELATAVAEKVADFEKQQAEKQKLYDAAVATINELEEQAKQLQLQVKRLMNTRFADIKAPDGTYNGLWPTLDMAKNFGLFIMADIGGNTKAAEELESLGIERRFMTKDGEVINAKDIEGTSITGGGAMIPTYFMGILPTLFGKFGVYRPDALEWPMASDSSYAAVQTDDVVVYAPGAGTQPTESSPGFKNVGLNAKKMMTLTAIDSECTEDMAIAIGEVVGRSIVRAFAKNEDKCGFLGDGTSTYFGFIGIGQALLNVDTSDITNVLGIQVQGTAGAWGAIDRVDILGMVGRVSGEADDGDCKWYCHRNFYYTVLVNIALGLGGTNATEIIQTGYTQNPRFLSRTVRMPSVMPRVKPAADHFPLFLGNLKQASLLGQSRGVTVDQSKEAYFKTDQIGMRGTERIAINNHGTGSKADASTIEEPAVVGLRGDIA
ncbi:MAG: phage major capsid protein [Phycisphaerae bacterium]|nr:phage major capsid protein [Phycisphaerae bacterium]